jgi:hypothetical protein
MTLSLQITEATLDDWKELKGLCIIITSKYARALQREKKSIKHFALA